MDLRPELRPPQLDEALVARLARLADQLDGDRDEEKRSEFNQLAGTDIPMIEFQGVSGGMSHEEFARRVLYWRLIKPVSDATREELAEVVRRAMPRNEFFDEHEAYMAIFEANVPLEGASNLIYYPPDYDEVTNTWGGGRPLAEYDPSPEQIVEWALDPRESADKD